MRMVSLFTVVTILCSNLISQSQAAENINLLRTDDSAKKIKEVVEDYVSNNVFEGVVLVSKSGDVIFKEAYGYADRSKNQLTTTEHSFQLASLTKPITATLILMLEEQGQLKLTDTLAKYFTEFDNPAGKKITIAHLLSHASGVPNHFEIAGWFDSAFHDKTSDKAFTNIIAKLSLKFEPGSDYLYSNPGYFLLGKVVEKISGEPYSTNVQKHIFTPLNMVSSGVAIGTRLISETVKGYQWNKDGGYRVQIAKNMNLFGAGAAVFSNVEDLHRFDMALYSDKLLGTKSKKRLFDPDNAYSWRVGILPLSPTIKVNAHMYDGKFDGFSTMMTRFVDDKHSIIILSNTGMSYALKQQLTLDIGSVLYKQETADRSNDLSFTLINSVVTGNFDKTFNDFESGKLKKNFDEKSLSSLAYELLWANFPDYSLRLFSFISNEFPSSTAAKKNLKKACNHRLANGVKNKINFCSASIRRDL